MDAIEIYNSLSRPPREVLREIQAGKLKGKTDINPQWRYKAMTEKFGLAGLGWKFEIQKLWTEPGAGAEKLAFAQVAVFVKDGDTWSDSVVGIGGSKLVQLEKGAAVSNDEGYKMAVTDAFSTALKMLGVAADIYAGMWDGSKYKDEAPAPQQTAPRGKYQRQAPQPAQQQEPPIWSREQLQEIIGVLNSTYSDGAPVFSDQEKEIYNKMYKERVDFVTTIKQARDTLATRQQQRQAQQPEATAPQPTAAPQPEADADIF